METLATIWFVLIIVLWMGYLFLDGFDLGVGMLLPVFSRDERRRRVLLNAIGPVWDGNEVWLITAAGATFAAFPHWYASLFSALYVPLTLCLLALIFRAVAIEYRGKGHTRAWRSTWTWAMALGSLGTAFFVGALLAVTSTGLPLNEHGDLVGGAFAWLGWPAVIGGLGAVGFSLVHALIYLGLKTEGPIRARARRWALRAIVPASVPFLVWFATAALSRTWLLLVVAVAVGALAGAIVAVRAEAEKRAFVLHGVYLVAGLGAVFSGVYPVVLPSTLDPAHSLTIASASSSEYTLGVMLVVTVIFLPIIIGYQIFSYRMFLGRLRETHIPEAHRLPVAIRS
ncbi:cytochrome bd-I ubiquinol oxidase subunit 2 apoprotein [Brevibacterium sanguinis]|uniref:Cytochrome bd-I ubiquinol oxidase subunit 2 apoprotein n=2 Tax=Brevibacterium TaxID=1696 RepID=A0A366IJR6_9MICO|nr:MULTISPECIES: cytochrome d ubiquinol oxidase subunit II [Brevibacterium]RBP64011.1 cytochrome bd-I ubiquinol oxidase subunit 2 apoprotein [Brevibacterium sanguinis]RBP70714.1 cytochrome bd-I ubiquinol oxidase subunit 2 apoprotein [Brevibacterium celere]